jgi:6-oxo-cyclohex-1-ene-carbonyl-CoA hydrolase
VEHVNHELAAGAIFKHVDYERRPVLGWDGLPVEGLHAVCISLNNPEQLNSYTTEAIKDIILAFGRASCDRAAVAVIFTGKGDRAFCTGGNTAEYSEYYAGRPGEYRQYMRLFNDMVSGILSCDKPVVNRVNGMRIGGGQEIGMACDFTLASDLARFGQAGPKHGSAPDGGSTDFLDLYVSWSQAAWSCVVCEPWSAHQALQLGLINDIFPVLKVDGAFVANPLVETQRLLDEWGKPALGRAKSGDALKAGKAVLKSGSIDFQMLDAGVDELVTKLAHTMPDCTVKTLESLRKKKLEHWDKNRETNRAWLALNMMTEARAGFQAFHRGTRELGREVDFLELRRRLAQGEDWGPELIKAVSPQHRTEGRK